MKTIITLKYAINRKPTLKVHAACKPAIIFEQTKPQPHHHQYIKVLFPRNVVTPVATELMNIYLSNNKDTFVKTKASFKSL